jgi:hypothetical protein
MTPEEESAGRYLVSRLGVDGANHLGKLITRLITSALGGATITVGGESITVANITDHVELCEAQEAVLVMTLLAARQATATFRAAAVEERRRGFKVVAPQRRQPSQQTPHAAEPKPQAPERC